MSKLTNHRWTLVQHSAWETRQDPAFKNAVEPAGLATHQELGEVIDAGAPVFDSLPKAEDAADDVSQDCLDRTLFPGQVSADKAPVRLDFHPTLTFGGRHLFLSSGNGN